MKAYTMKAPTVRLCRLHAPSPAAMQLSWLRWTSLPPGRQIPGRGYAMPCAAAAQDRAAEPAELETVEQLPSGRSVQKLITDAGTTRRRSIADLPEDVVKRLVKDYVSMKPPLKLGRRGVTGKVAADVQMRWNTRECVKVEATHKNCKGDMRATAAALEELTGGIVVWRSGAKLLVFRDDGHNPLRPAWEAQQQAKKEAARAAAAELAALEQAVASDDKPSSTAATSEAEAT